VDNSTDSEPTGTSIGIACVASVTTMIGHSSNLDFLIGYFQIIRSRERVPGAAADFLA
jgi:hypothetical protein